MYKFIKQDDFTDNEVTIKHEGLAITDLLSEFTLFLKGCGFEIKEDQLLDCNDDRNPKDLYEALKHGDEEHQIWLHEAIHAWFQRKPVPEPRGSGTKDKLYKEVKRLTEENEFLKRENDALKLTREKSIHENL